MKAMVLGLGLAVVLAAVIGLSLVSSTNGAQGQVGPVAANVRAADGAAPYQAVVVNTETFQAMQAVMTFARVIAL